MQKENPRKRLRSLIYNVSSLPTLPVIASQVMQLLYSPQTSVQELARVISSDQSLTTAVLKLVNSSYYGYPRQISTIKHALVILGFNEIRNITLTVSILRAFSRGKTFSFFNYKAFWKHSLGAAVTAKMLAKFFRYRVSGKVFVAGLVHDIGKIILSQYARDLFEKVTKEVASCKISFYLAEKSTLGITHAEIGSWLAYHWNLPQEIEETIKFHHSPSEAKLNPSLCSVVHLADILVRMKSIGESGDKEIFSPDPAIWKILQSLRPDFDESYMEYFMRILEEEVEKAKPFFDIIC